MNIWREGTSLRQNLMSTPMWARRPKHQLPKLWSTPTMILPWHCWRGRWGIRRITNISWRGAEITGICSIGRRASCAAGWSRANLRGSLIPNFRTITISTGRQMPGTALSTYPTIPPGLVTLYDSPGQFEEKLDELCNTPWNPEHIARNVSCFLGHYMQVNQPSHNIPYLSYYIRKQSKSQEVLHILLGGFCGVGEDGLAPPRLCYPGATASWFVYTS